MPNLISNATRVLQQPQMLRAYFRWLSRKALVGAVPRLRVADRTTIGEWISFSEYWSFHEGIPDEEMRFIQQAADAAGPGAVAVDVGSNIGVFTCALAATGFKEVHSFEPVPETFCRLRRNVEANGLQESCRLNCMALGAVPGLVEFAVNDRDPATNRMSEGGGLKAASTSRLSVAVTSLDEYCKALGIAQIAFLKIDVEGMEPLVLKGARNLLASRKVGAILMEVCPNNLRLVGRSVEDLWEEIVRSPYRPYQLGLPVDRPQALTLSELKGVVLENVALLPQG